VIDDEVSETSGIPSYSVTKYCKSWHGYLYGFFAASTFCLSLFCGCSLDMIVVSNMICDNVFSCHFSQLFNY
jgi:hypothetical protein